MSSKLTERAQMIVTFQYLRISTGMFIGLFVSMEMKKKKRFGTKIIKIITSNEPKCESCLNLHNNDWYNYTIKLLVVIPARFFMLNGKL